MSRYRTASHPGLTSIRALVMVAFLAVAAACSGGATSSSGGSSSGSGPMVVGILAPFTGQDAALGPAYFAGFNSA